MSAETRESFANVIDQGEDYQKMLFIRLADAVFASSELIGDHIRSAIEAQTIILLQALKEKHD